MVDYEVAVIGAGISGIAAVKCFRDKNLSVVCLEKSDDIGGLWNFTENGYGVMRFTHINVSKQNYVFSDFPFPDDVPDFPHHSQLIKYIRDYASHFKLRKHIWTNCMVVNIKQLSNGLWKITFDKGKYNEREGQQSITVRNVSIATGHHSNPHIPKIPGEESYTGMMYHSIRYKCAATSGIPPGKRVLVVGMGNSAVDIADNLVTQGQSHVDISARSPTWVFSPYVLGCPVDHYATRGLYLLPLTIVEKIVQTLICVLLGLPKQWGIYPLSSILRSQPTVSHTLYHHIQRGKISIKPDIASLGPGKKVTFNDGTAAWYDGIILATGYTFGLPFLGKSDREHILTGVNEINLYKNVFSPRFGQSLSFIGFIQPSSGGLVTMSEMQARWVAELISGNIVLPTPSEMQTSINQDRQWERSWYYNSKRLTVQKIPILYNDELAEMIGCKPNIKKHPTLAWNLMLSVSAFQWRLDGPDKWEGAEEMVRRIKPTPFYHYSTLFVLTLVVFVVLGILKFVFSQLF